jgi:hypothetical protein
MTRIKPVAAVPVIAALLLGCGSSSGAGVTSQGGDAQAEPITTEAPAAPHGMQLAAADIEEVSDELLLVPDQLALISPAGRRMTADLGHIVEQADRIPERLAGIDPAAYFGVIVRRAGSAAREHGPAVIALRFEGVRSGAVGGVPGAAKAKEVESIVVAVYDAASGDEIGVYTFGCAEPGC